MLCLCVHKTFVSVSNSLEEAFIFFIRANLMTFFASSVTAQVKYV